jgi:hypothetical protein
MISSWTTVYVQDAALILEHVLSFKKKSFYNIVKQNGGVYFCNLIKALEYYQNNDEVMMFAVDNNC